MPARKKVEDFNTLRYPEGFVPQAERRHQIVRGWLAHGGPKRVLDVGCNEGLLGELLLKDGHTVFGADISARALSVAQKRGLRVYQLDLGTDKLPFEDGTLDVVTACEVIAHIYDTSHLLREVRRVLQKGGLFIITTPNTLSLGRRLAYLLGKGVFFEASLEDEDAAGAIRFFTKELLLTLLRRHNFEPLKFTSDFVNIGGGGLLQLKWLAKIFPALGSSLIVSARKIR